ncbi:MAG: cytochrome c maturation protein CcmE [Chloroflexi bacterium]|nr:cytochrome c maturation protein CcmE [Chloroflexota bacterium]
MKRKWIVVIAAVVLAAGLGYLAYSLFFHRGADYITVSQLKSSPLQSGMVKVGGRVAAGSIDWDKQAQVVKFVLTDDRENLAAVYKGIAPDNFKPGSDMVMVGKYNADGVFEVLGFDTGSSFCSVCH